MFYPIWSETTKQNPIQRSSEFAFAPYTFELDNYNELLLSPDAQCMVYLPTFTPKTTQM